MQTVKIDKSLELDYIIQAVSVSAGEKIATKIFGYLPENYSEENPEKLTEIFSLLTEERIREGFDYIKQAIAKKPLQAKEQTEAFIREVASSLTGIILKYIPLPENLRNTPLPSQLKTFAIRAVAMRTLEEGLVKIISLAFDSILWLLYKSGIVTEEVVAKLKRPLISGNLQ